MHCRVCPEAVLSEDSIFICSACKCTYHLACGGINENTFRRLTQERRAQQKCKQCKKDTRSAATCTTILTEISDTAPLDPSKKTNKTSASTSQPSTTNLEDLHDLVIFKTTNLEKKQNDILDQNNKILENIQFISAQYEDFLARIRNMEQRNDELTKKNTALEARITVLENGLEFQERALKANNAEVRGIPEIKGENLQDVMFNICQTTKSSIQTKDIDSIYRSAKKNNKQNHPREIIIKLKTNLARDQLLADVKSFNKNQHNTEDKLNTLNIGIAGPRSPIYVSEQLTFRSKQLWFKTRQYAKERMFRFAWIKGGNIYIRKEAGTNAILISDESKLSTL